MTTRYRKIVALGSSYAAGPGIEPVVNRAAMRSGNNYAHLVATRAGAELVDLTVSGATTATILSDRQRVGRTVFEPQVCGVPADTDLVTITAAGNDLGYLGAAIGLGIYFTVDRLTRGTLHRLKAPPRPRATADQSRLATDGLRRIVEEVRRRGPQARIVLVDYLPMVAEATTPRLDVPFDAETIDALITIHSRLNEAFAAAASATGGDLIPASELGRGHELGTREPWIQPLYFSRRLPASFHPNAAGMAAIGEAIIERLGT